MQQLVQCQRFSFLLQLLRSFIFQGIQGVICLPRLQVLIQHATYMCGNKKSASLTSDVCGHTRTEKKALMFLKHFFLLKNRWS